MQLKNNNRTKQLCATIAISAKLNFGMSRLANVLDGMGALRRISSGSALRYAVIGSPDTLFEFTASSASVSYYFDLPSLAQRAESLAMLLSLLAYVKDAYDLRTDSLYEVVVDMLRQMQHMHEKTHEECGDAEALIERIRALSGANAALAHAVMELRASNEAAHLDLSAYAEFCGRAVRSTYLGNLDSALAELGIGAKLAERIRDRERSAVHA